ncbi:hypothetical protein [Planctomicrobium piriforme]|uniref:C2H2-type domain-containing protein n=1 Tax=Planctomicrobium piriforme TaxID=1576369 RepID=A0A1I3TA56_9PLAN|nr:hypothetical protein [Planctomicrobium piriforme]SFJ66556.1 hypothetical protein SAMN05421753_1286 [Planctomicrobium piriforme]
MSEAHQKIGSELHRSAFRWGSVICISMLVAGVAASAMRATKPPVIPAIAIPPGQRVSQTRCADCHIDVTDDFALTPHANTLHKAMHPAAMPHFAGQTFRDEATGNEFRFEVRDGRLFMTSPAYGRDVEIDWIFGSGTHAQTPLLTWPNDNGALFPVEGVVSWYPGHGLATTLKRTGDEPASGIAALGTRHSAPELLACFGCHSNAVPTNAKNEILFHQLEPNLGCAQCHWNSDVHVRELDEGNTSTIERLSELTPLESVNRCGRCHRRANEQDPHAIAAHDESIVRFASVGFVQSPCFLKQETVQLEGGLPARFDCVTCHDPHRTVPRDWTYYAQTCLKCHDAAQGRAADCTAAARTSNCIECHMPKEATNPYLSFTDHWIRIREKK